MSLATGTRLGAYEVVALIGAGGMGEVYRARDTRLQRDVAIKVLPDAFAADTERLARFEREAQVLASLNHANIAAIHGLEENGGTRALVLEFVDGPTLADRIAHGPMALEEALPIAHQIAEALEAAHEHGIVHRDLKPANIKVRPDGTVKVLDFGLAKALDTGAAATPDRSAAPTITSPAMMTGIGVVLGTAAYMAPEQARGLGADRRSDVWAFGCVLYEMLTGRRAFRGDEGADVLVAVLSSEPDWHALPSATPLAIHRLLHRCLQKDRKARLPDIGSARLDIDDAGAPHLPDRVTLSRPGARRIRMGAAGLVAGLVSGGTVWLATRPSAPRVTRLTIGVSGPSLAGASTNNWDVAITPDGRRIAYLAGSGSTLQLHVRALDQLESTALPAGSDVVAPFASTNGEWFGFWDEAETPSAMRKIAVAGGGQAQTITRSPAGASRGASWGDDNSIVFATTDPSTGLFRVADAGGTPEVLTKPDPGTDHLFPDVLPGSRAVLFTVVQRAMPPQVAVLDLDTRRIRVIIENGSQPRYSTSGHILYAADGMVHAVRFDAQRLEVTGIAVSVLEGVVTKQSGAADFSIASNGTLIYRRGGAFGSGGRTLVWVDRQGREEPLEVPLRRYAILAMSPDGMRAALDVRDQQNDTWIWNLGPRTLSRLTLDPGIDGGVAWTPDGQRVAFSRGSDNGNIYWQAADGTGSPERLTQRERAQRPTAFAPDGSALMFSEPAASPRDLGVVWLRGERRSELLLGETPFDELNAEISPDGRWIAYESNESGRREIYVRPFPDVQGGRWQVSSNGGTRPLWGRDGRELFYWSPAGALDTATGQLMALPVETGRAFTYGNAQPLTKGTYVSPHPGRSYDVSADGRRFLVIKDASASESSQPEIVVVQNWTEELKRLAPVN